ncbi:alpha/beta fold hydrolase [Luethyella okanaganae]|uniref:Alpha/beta fold hydrolase n=1 Tax=Luethyella okanaganae TaxID=69372 RepID=A0ABW1VI53_9MICO
MAWLGELLGRFRRRKAPILHVASDVCDGPVVVMVHGIASTSVTFQHLVPMLERRHRCMRWERHASSGRARP